jgi:hypothetical protein
MGSYDFTCAASGLAIHARTPVRALLLASRNGGAWTPRTYPVRAVYDDYGSIESVEPGVLQDLWLEGLKLDLVENGPTTHRTYALKDMDFNQLLSAVQANQVKVQKTWHTRDSDLIFGSRFPDFKMPEWRGAAGWPTLRRLMDIFKEAGLPLFNEGKPEHYAFDEEFPGSMRVRWESRVIPFNHETSLKKAQELLSRDFAVMMTCPTNGAWYPELVVRPLPFSKDADGHDLTLREGLTLDKNPIADIALTMIREDVWQTMAEVARTLTGFRETRDRLEAVTEMWGKYTSMTVDEIRNAYPMVLRSPHHHALFDGHFNPGNHSPTTLGLGSHWLLMVRRALSDKPPTPGEVDEFLKTVAEILLVDETLFLARVAWTPGTSHGPQDGHWHVHHQLFSAYAAISKAAADREDRIEDEDD